jgi:hypothetical protein
VTGYDDFEPEDVWDAGDPPDVQLRNIIRRVLLMLEDLRTVHRRLADADDDDG